MEIACLLQTS